MEVDQFNPTYIARHEGRKTLDEVKDGVHDREIRLTARREELPFDTMKKVIISELTTDPSHVIYVTCSLCGYEHVLGHSCGEPCV